jgi:hypothetical protein
MTRADNFLYWVINMSHRIDHHKKFFIHKKYLKSVITLKYYLKLFLMATINATEYSLNHSLHIKNKHYMASKKRIVIYNT